MMKKGLPNQIYYILVNIVYTKKYIDRKKIYSHILYNMDNMLQLSNYIGDKYGSIYTKNGNGRVQVGGTKVKDFAKKILGNRVLDIYLKYNAIKLLNSATIVPFAFILGKEYLSKVVNQTGGGDPIPQNIPILDHPLVGTYLKILGVSTLDLTMGALLPLGTLMIIHDLYKNSDGLLIDQSGGSRTIVGSSVPANFFQKIDGAIRGQGWAEHNFINSFPEVNTQMQLACSGGSCGPNPSTTVNNLGINTVIPSSMAGGGPNFNYITNPITGLISNINSKEGNKILNNYLKTLK